MRIICLGSLVDGVQDKNRKLSGVLYLTLFLIVVAILDIEKITCLYWLEIAQILTW